MTEQEKRLRDELRLKIDGEGRRNYAVTAGAGGGKTTMLSHRICRQLCEGEPIENFAVITYTNAAAGELREKITERLQTAAADPAEPAQSRENAARALQSIEQMQISTIHSFLLNILRENAFASHVAPGAVLLGGTEDQQRKELFFNKWYRAHYPDFDFLRSDWYAKEENGTLLPMLRRMFCALANVRETIWYDEEALHFDAEAQAQAYNDLWLPQLRQLKDDLTEHWPLNKNGTQKQLSRDGEKLFNYIADAELADGIGRAVLLSEALKMLIRRVNNDGVKSVFQRTDADLDFIDAIDLPENRPEQEWYFAGLLRMQKTSKATALIITAQQEYQQLIDQQTQELSNDDILYRADRLLKGHPEVLQRLREKYRKIYVDEFQDTTRLQTDIVRLLAGYDGAPEGCPFAEDRLMLVGDPKQSIYRFTGAEKSIFDGIITEMDQMPQDNARAATLHANFRSNREIVDWVNDRFGKLMGTDYTEMTTDWIPQDPDALHGVFRFSATDSYPDNPSAVAHIIKKLTDSDFFCLEEYHHDAPEGQKFVRRRIRYSDFFVITDKAKNVTSLFSEKFAAEGIPVSIQGKYEVDDDEVLGAFVTMVKWLANPKDTVLRHAAAMLVTGKDPTQLTAEKRSEALEELNDLKTRLCGADQDPAATVRRLLKDEHLFFPKRKTPYLPETLRMHRIRLHQMVEACLSACTGDLTDLAAQFTQYLAKEVDREVPPESNLNAVRLMNVHKAKGLTGNIVIISNRDKSTGVKYGSFKKDEVFYPAFSTDFSNTFYPTFAMEQLLMEQAACEEQQDTLRLEYVAATRAAHTLIFCPNVKDKWFSAPEYDIDSLPDIADRMDAQPPVELPEDEVQTRRGEVLTLADLRDNLAARNDAPLPVFSLMPSALEGSGKSGFTPQDPGHAAENRPSGNVFGTILHRVFELAVLLPDTNAETLIRTALSEQEEDLHWDDDPEEIRRFLLNKLPDYRQRILAPALADAEEILPEFSFSFFVPPEDRAAFDEQFLPYLKEAERQEAGSAEQILVNGQADLVVRYRDGSVRVYDYKSDRRDGKPIDAFEAAACQKYEGQLALYRYAVGRCFGIEPSGITTELIHMYR